MSRLADAFSALVGTQPYEGPRTPPANWGPAGISNDNSTTQNLTAEEMYKMYSGTGFGSFAGRGVTERSAMSCSSVFACVSLIAGSIGTLPLNVFERSDQGRKEAKGHPYWWLFNERPNPAISAAVFLEYVMNSLLFHGDAFAYIIRPNKYANEITGLLPIHPYRVQVYPIMDGRLNNEVFYIITPQFGVPIVVDAGDMLHIPGAGFDGLRGMSVIQWGAKQAIGTALAAEEYSAKFFGNGARPDFVLQTEGKLDKPAADLLRTTWMARHQGAENSHLPAVLTGGLKVEQISMTSEDAQLILTRGFQVEDICRFFGVPPTMVGHSEKTSSWGTGVEQLSIGFKKFTLARHLNKIEEEINFKAWPLREKYFVEFDTAVLERGDAKSEAEAFRIALGRAGEPAWMTQDEVRQKKHLIPLGGDAGKLPANATPAKDSTKPTEPAKGTK